MENVFVWEPIVIDATSQDLSSISAPGDFSEKNYQKTIYSRVGDHRIIKKLSFDDLKMKIKLTTEIASGYDEEPFLLCVVCAIQDR